MAHEVESMAYVGELPWHGLGTYVGDQDVSAQDMQRAAGLEWRVEKAPLYTADGSNVPDLFAITREGKPFAGVAVGRMYEPFQNDDLFGFIEDLRTAGGGDVLCHTAGSLKGGRRVWALARVAGGFSVTHRDGRRDDHATFLLIYNSHDGSSRITVRPTDVRVVCQNTARMALSGPGSSIKVRHTGSIGDRMTEAAEALGLVMDRRPAHVEELTELARRPMGRGDFTRFVAQLLTGEDDSVKACRIVAAAQGRARDNLDRKGSELVRLFESGRGNEGADAYDAFCAVTEFVDHQRNRSRRWRATASRLGAGFDSAQWGAGAALKERAFRLLS